MGKKDWYDEVKYRRSGGGGGGSVVGKGSSRGSWVIR